MLKTLSFEYEGKNGEVTKRVLVAHKEPVSMFSGTDISELDVEDQAMYLHDLKKIHETYIKELEYLNTTYDLGYRYRQFKPENMRNINKEAV